MSAINEWFGYQNAILLYMMRTYGEEELDRYLGYLAKTAYNDVTPVFRAEGLPVIERRYTANLKKDGDETSVTSELDHDTLTLRIRCPAFYHAAEERHPDRQCGPFYCDCCKKLETMILREAGYALTIDLLRCGDCVWTIRKNA